MEINFKNGSTIKAINTTDNVRGHRSKYVEPFWGDEPYVDSNIVKEVVEKFLNKERFEDTSADSDIYLSSTNWLKEEQ